MEYKYIELNTNIRKTNMLDNIIFKNFSSLEKYKELTHNLKHIKQLLDLPYSKIIAIIENNKIISYMIISHSQLRNRNVTYLYYIFTSIQFRNKGIGTELLNYLEEYTKRYKLDGIMLICDSSKKIYNWYMTKGYMIDIIYKTNSRFECLYKPII